MLIQSNGKKYGFSLAEALITILIIGLVAILSVPLCKKLVKKDNNPNKGVWMATRDSKGDAVYWTTGMGNKDNPDKWTKCKTQCTINGELVDDCCVFDSPLNVRNFSLTAVGGGGGGAGANVELKKFTSSFRVDNPGYYRMLAIGGGGAGSLWNCDRSWLKNAGGGGTGGLGYAEFTLGDDAKYIYYTVGNGGTNCDYHGSAGSDSYITIQYANGSSEEDKNYIESPYSLNSTVDFADNIRSIQNAYEGSNDGDKSVSDYIASVDADKDKALKDAIDAAITAIENIPEPFAKNATGQATKDAITAVAEVSNSLSEVARVLNEN